MNTRGQACRIGGFLLTALLIPACGGGAGNSTITGGSGSGYNLTGLVMPAKLSVVTADTLASKSSALKLDHGDAARSVSPSLETFAADSNYNTDRTDVWVWDDSMQTLNLVNQILCYMGQLHSAELVAPRGYEYTALVDIAKCEQGKNRTAQTSGTTQTASSSQNSVQQYQRWIVRSTRRDNQSPQTVQIWIPGNAAGDDPYDAQRMEVEVTINEGVSASKPFGDFVLNFRGTIPDDFAAYPALQGATSMVGTLRTMDNWYNKPQFLFVELEGQAVPTSIDPRSVSFSRYGEQSANIVLDDASGSNGTAMVSSGSWEMSMDDGSDPLHPEQDTIAQLGEVKFTNYAANFNSELFLRGMDNARTGFYDQEQICSSRNSGEFTSAVFSYNLYHAADGTFNAAPVTAGQKVTLNAGFPFEYYDASGLEHYGHIGYWGLWSDDNTDLSALDGKTVTKETREGSGTTGTAYTLRVSPGKLHRSVKKSATWAELNGVPLNWYGVLNDTGPADYRVSIQGTSLWATGTIDWNTGTVTELGQNIDMTGMITAETQLWMWADTLGGQVVISNTNTVTFYADDTVTADETATDGTLLYCYEWCPKGGITSTTPIATESDLFQILNGTGNFVTYTVRVSDGTVALFDAENRPVDFTQADLSNLIATYSWYSNGVQSGPMIPNQLANSWWEAYEQPLSYRWESGTNAWNRTVSAVADGTVVKFDRPLQLSYTFAAEDERNGNPAGMADGSTMLLEYGGPGNLYGFPWEGSADCTTNDCRWYPSINLKDGVEMSDQYGNRFVVKAREIEQTMKKFTLADNTPDLSPCVDAQLDVSGINLRLPSQIDGLADIGAPPTVLGGPAVIGGELQ